MGKMDGNQNREIWDCIVIGGGIAGLTAATYLARAGKSVLLLERSKMPGGRAVTSEKKGSYLNLGPHALYSKGKSIEILSQLGIEVPGGNPSLDGRVISYERFYGLPVEPLKLLKSRLFSWKGKLELIDFFIKMKKYAHEEENERLTLQQWLSQNIKDENAKKFLLMLVRLSSYCHDANLIRAKDAFRQLQLGKAIYIHGGWRVLVNALLEKALAARVKIKLGMSVEHINGEYPLFSVAVKGNNSVLAKNILSTARPNDTCKMFEENDSLHSLKEMVPVRAACLDIVLNHLPNHNQSLVLSMDHPLYFSNHSTVARLSEDETHAVVHVLKYLDSEAGENEATVRVELEEFMDRVQSGWRQFVVYQRFLPNMTVSHLPKDGLSLPNVTYLQLPGVYLAGDWVGSEGMLADRAFISAKNAASAIIESLEHESSHELNQRIV